MPVIIPIPKSSFIVTISGMETIWTTFSGVVDTAESGQYANGTGNRIYKVVGPRAIDDVTLSAPYDPAFAHTIELHQRCSPNGLRVVRVNCRHSCAPDILRSGSHGLRDQYGSVGEGSR